MITKQNSARETKRLTAAERALCILLIGVVLCLLYAVGLLAASALPVQDLAQYWAAAHLVKTNPYSYAATSAFELSHGIPASTGLLVIKNPPWAIVFVLPLALLSYTAAFAAWMALSVLIVTACARASWSLFTPRLSLAPALISLLFGPTVVLLMLGQLTVLVLLGITIFLIAIERKLDWLAGVSLVLILIKPHVVFLFLIVAALWAYRSRRLAIIWFGSIALFVLGGAAMLINPHIFAQFLARARLVVGEDYPYPNLGGLIFVLSGHHGLALLPQVIGMIWALIYWHRHRFTWDWKTDGMFVLVLSIACSYYSYPYDEILLIPALLSAYALGKRGIFLTGFVIANLGYAIYISNLAGKFGFDSIFLCWTASVWLITYALSQRRVLEPAVG
jgi:hypothetical protein